MKARSTMRNQRRESGIALLIAIFVLLLISVVGIALIVSSGTESALAGNYRSATGVYYASLAGLEEARGRLLANNPNSFSKTGPPNFLPPPGTQWDIGYVRYILNPGPADPVNTLTAYPDVEYDSEFGNGKLAAANGAGTVATTSSVWNVAPLNALPVPGPLYKWVRINSVSEVSLKQQVAPYGDGHAADPAKPIYYDGTRLTIDPTGAREVLEVTSLAVVPNGTQNNSQKIVQYLAAPAPITLPPFLAALTLSGSPGPGNSPVFQAPANNASYSVKGDNYGCDGNPAASPGPVEAIGLFGDYSGNNPSADVSGIKGGIATNAGGTDTRPNYTGVSAAPDVQYLNAFPANLQTPNQIDAFAQTIIQNADAVVPAGSSSTQTAYLTSLGMSPTNMMTVVANGNLDISNWSHDGYGLLLVTGTFTYDPDTNWNGIILVIGQGIVNGSHMQNKKINGAMFVAKTRDTDGTLLTGRIGGANVSFAASMQGDGMRYSSCWIQKAQPTAGYQVLSFHEISQ
jgi:hypothetical protein